MKRIIFAGIAFLLLASHCLAANDALEEVNTWRSKRGLFAFIRHPFLSATSARSADYRAQHLIEPHSQHNFFPVWAAEGCAAATDDWGWLSCLQETREYRYAGAAWTRGRDGQRYMTLHVTNRVPVDGEKVTPLEVIDDEPKTDSSSRRRRRR